MNANEMMIHGFTGIINHLIAAAVAEAIKPLKERITVLETGEWTKTQHIVVKEIQPLEERILALEGRGSEWTAMEHVAAKAVQPLQDRIIALEINEAKGDFSEAIRNILIGYNFVTHNEVVDLVTGLVDDAIENHDFDLSNEIEEGINNYDFGDIIEENMPDDFMNEERVQDMINESLDNLVITRN